MKPQTTKLEPNHELVIEPKAVRIVVFDFGTAVVTNLLPDKQLRVRYDDNRVSLCRA